MEITTPVRHRMTTFAAIGGAVIGVWHVIAGIAGITDADGVETVHELLFGIDLTIFGWFWLIVGVAQVVTAWFILQRNPAGLLAGVVWATVSAIMAVFVIFQAPIWALAILVIDAVIIRALVDDPTFGEF